MSDTLLGKWLRHYDPLHRGLTPRGIANGVCATSGFSFPRIKGGYNLRRAAGGVPTINDAIVGAAGCDAVMIRTFPWVTHAASTSYNYGLWAIGGGGVEHDNAGGMVETAFNAGSEWVGPRPNPPSDLRVASLAGGSLLVKWTYSRSGEQARPAEFHVYNDGGTGEIDWLTPAATVAYVRGRFHYEYVSAPFTHDTRVRWAVRAVSAMGVEETNDLRACEWAKGQAPPINPSVLISTHNV